MFGVVLDVRDDVVRREERIGWKERETLYVRLKSEAFGSSSQRFLRLSAPLFSFYAPRRCRFVSLSSASFPDIKHS